MNTSKVFTALAVAVLVPLAGANQAASAVSAPKFGEYQAHRFLSDYSKIPTSASEDGTYRYRDPSADLGKYHKLLVDRIKIFFKEDSDYKGIDADELKMLTDYFYEALEKALADAYPMVAEPGPDVLRLRIAITDLVPNEPSASVTSLIVPFLWVGEAGAGAATREAGTTPFTGQASIEAEVMDSTTSKQLGAYIETRMGKKYNWSQGLSKGIDSYIDAYSKWEYTKEAIDYWVALLRKRLDETRAKAAGG